MSGRSPAGAWRLCHRVPESGHHVVVSTPEAEPDLWQAYLDGAERVYGSYGVEAALELDTMGPPVVTLRPGQAGWTIDPLPDEGAAPGQTLGIARGTDTRHRPRGRPLDHDPRAVHRSLHVARACRTLSVGFEQTFEAR